MPLLTDSPDLGGVGHLPAPEAPQPSPSLGETTGAAFRTNNIAGSLYDFAQHPRPDKVQPGFDPLASVPAGYEKYADRFLDSMSPEDNQWTKDKIDSELRDRQTIARAGKLGVVASLAAGATDPLTIASMFIPGAGETRLIQAARFAAINAGTTAAQEGVMHAISPTRTTEESLFNIGAGTVLGGLFGAALRPHIPNSAFESLRGKLAKELQPDGGERVLGPNERMAVDTTLPSDHPDLTQAQADMRAAVEPPSMKAEKEPVEDLDKTDEWKGLSAPGEPITTDLHINPGEESTSGAAAVAKPTMEGERIASGARTLAEGLVGKVSPGLRLLTSPSLETRRIAQELANTPEMLEKNYSGIATPQPVERALWGYDGVWRQGLKARAELFRTYRERIAGEGGTPLSRGEFGEQVAAAMRRGDQHEIPEVAQAAQKTRAIVFDPLKERAQKLGLLPEKVMARGADSYLTRQYNARAIRENLPKWLDTLTEGFKAQGVETAEARDIAHQVTRNVVGGERGTMDWKIMDDVVPRSGRMKERTLDLPDQLLEPFLNNDIDHLSHSYLRSMAPEVEMTERFGSRDMKDQIDAINDDYARLMEKANAKGEDIAPLEARRQHDLRDLSAIRDRLYGIYGQPKDPGAWYVRAGRVLRSDNALRLLGAATLAHIPDFANVTMRYGLGNTFAAVAKVLFNSSLRKLTFSEAQRMGAALDMVTNTTASLLGDFGNHSQFPEQRFLNRATRAFTIATGETPLITLVQGVTSTLAQHEVLTVADKLARGVNVGSDRMARLASAGLDRDLLARIGEQGQQFGVKANGLRFGMSDRWADQRAAAAFESAILKEAHGVTLRPGAGDTPLIMSGELGKMIMQFQTFAYAASRIVVNPLMQGLAHGDQRAVQGLFALVTAGFASYAAKQTAAGQPIEWDNPGRLAAEVLDKSNLMGWTSNLVFPALWQLGMKDLSRWSDRDPVETIGGPSLGTVAGTYERRLPQKLTAPEGEKGVSRSDLHFLRRLVPGQNLWYLRRGVNALEDAVGDMFDLPGKSNADREAERQAKESLQ